MAERVVVSGLGAVTCLGLDANSTWDNLLAGRSGLRRHDSLSPELFLQSIAGLVEGVGPGSGAADPALDRLPSRFLHLGLKAAREAWADAGLNAERVPDPHRVAVIAGSALGGLDFLAAEQSRMAQRKNLSTSPFLVPGLIANQLAGQIAQHLGLFGPSVAPANACAAGGHAIALAAMMLQTGQADIALCGASENAFMPAIVNGFATMKALFTRKDDPRAALDPGQASRPFSADRAGFIMSEGAAFLVLCTGSTAKKLGLEPKAELLGFALNSDGYHMAMPNGPTIVRCLSGALRNTGLAPADIDYYNAHGTSTVVNDRVETQALKEVFGDHAGVMPVSSIKGALGHSLGAASAIEAVVTVLSLVNQCVPPTINYVRDPELDLDYVPNESRQVVIRRAMSASFGFGGTNNALVFGRCSGD